MAEDNNLGESSPAPPVPLRPPPAPPGLPPYEPFVPYRAPPPIPPPRRTSKTDMASPPRPHRAPPSAPITVLPFIKDRRPYRAPLPGQTSHLPTSNTEVGSPARPDRAPGLPRIAVLPFADRSPARLTLPKQSLGPHSTDADAALSEVTTEPQKRHYSNSSVAGNQASLAVEQSSRIWNAGGRVLVSLKRAGRQGEGVDSPPKAGGVFLDSTSEAHGKTRLPAGHALMGRTLDRVGGAKKSTDLKAEQRAMGNPFERVGLIDPLRSHPPMDMNPRDFTLQDFGPRTSSLQGDQIEQNSTPDKTIHDSSLSPQEALEHSEGPLAENKSVATNQDPFGGISIMPQEEKAIGTALSPKPYSLNSVDKDDEAENNMNTDANLEVGVKFQMKAKASIAGFSTFGHPEASLGQDDTIEVEEEPQAKSGHDNAMEFTVQKEQPEPSPGQVAAMDSVADEQKREAKTSQVITLEPATEIEETFSQKLVIRSHQYRFESAEDPGLREPSPSKLEKYVKELLEKDERTGGRMLQAVRYVSVRGPWYPSDHFMMSNDDIPPSKPPRLKRSPRGKDAKDGDNDSQNDHQAHERNVADVAGDAAEYTKEHEMKARIKREGMQGITLICQILSKTINIEGFDWVTDMPFEKEIWSYLPTHTITTLMIDVFRPGLRGDRYGGDVLPVADLYPLKGFKKLQSLCLRGMVESYQEVIWEAVWGMPDLKYLDLKVMVEPGVRSTHLIHWPYIEGDWKVKELEEISTGHSHIQGGNVRNFYEGFGEYLDYVKMVIARNKALPGKPNAKLGIEALELGGFAVDSKPFEHCFDLTKLKQITFSESCLDAGFALPKLRHPELKVVVPPGPEIRTAMTAVRYDLKKDLKIVTIPPRKK